MTLEIMRVIDLKMIATNTLKYFKNQMTNNYQREKNTLKRIIHNDVKHHNQGKKIKFLITIRIGK